jgi:hypothetical protein
MGKRAFILAIAIAALVAGCGSSSDSSGPTKAEFIKEGDALCQKANKEFQKEFAALGKEHQKKGIEGRTIREEGIEISEKLFLPNAQGRAEALASLTPPSGEEAEIEAIIAAIEEGVKTGEKDPNLLFNQKAYPFAKANELQQNYGFKYCGAGTTGA